MGSSQQRATAHSSARQQRGCIPDCYATLLQCLPPITALLPTLVLVARFHTRGVSTRELTLLVTQPHSCSVIALDEDSH
jgi:hypothetical protein